MRLLYKLQGGPVGVECPQCKRDITFAPLDRKTVTRANIDAAMSDHYRESPECFVAEVHAR